MKRKKLSSALLDNVYLASPCSMSWESMSGDDHKRACSGCGKNVFNLSEMTRAEAEAFLVENGTSQCAIFFRREDGSVMTDDCPRALRKLRNQCKLIVKVATGLIAFLVALPSHAQGAQDGKNGQKDTAGSTKLFEVSPQVNKWEAVPRIPLPGGMMLPPRMDEAKRPPDKPEAVHPKVTKIVRAKVKTVTTKTPDGKKFTEVKPDSDGNVIRIISIPDKAVPNSTDSSGRPANKVDNLPVEPTLTELQAADAHRLMDTRASDFHLKGKQALKDGHYELAEFYFEKALEAFDSQKCGDKSYRELIENDLKNIKSLQSTPN